MMQYDEQCRDCRRRFFGAIAVVLLALPAGRALAEDRVLAVGPTRHLRTVAEAAALARDGDVVEIDPGEYRGDVAVWTQDRVRVQAAGGRVRLIAAGASAEHKAIWVVRGGAMTVENIDFVGARVPDRNGAGIRFERGRLTVRNCRFVDNEDGILAGNDGDAVLVVEGSEFDNNGAGDGQSHNLYVGSIGALRVTGSYFHHARIGHLLKSRARENYIAYNRLTDEEGGQASYELEFPNGGIAYVMGNIVEQGARTRNPYLISFGAEGYRWPRNELYLVHNTLIDDRRYGGRFLRFTAGAQRIVAANNLMMGKDDIESAGPGEYVGNVHADRRDFGDAAHYDYHLRRDFPLPGKPMPLPPANGVLLVPDQEYVHRAQARQLPGEVLLPGALQTYYSGQ